MGKRDDVHRPKWSKNRPESLDPIMDASKTTTKLNLSIRLRVKTVLLIYGSLNQRVSITKVDFPKKTIICQKVGKIQRPFTCSGSDDRPFSMFEESYFPYREESWFFFNQITSENGFVNLWVSDSIQGVSIPNRPSEPLFTSNYMFR